ncbi:Excalibur calcium-binding domain-containing protein [Halobacillus dabanensis]|uniref:Excalibur calcium-binding domain-containing protein n=1 Tax=Halobacillus dabanensis TaxID=240302 RepID=A0A1I3T8Z5_HALDA|nr:excalibur calcium-binding domain-containing protein [Halobacillus dabanensis]SFJ66992.1 Excalibur calcium-binding domain-containing protein [Halobacillus dabanensis]
MKKWLTGLFAIGLVFSTSGVVGAAEDKDCSDFETTAEAEAYWEENGYDENNDPDRLDRDKDGIPCESLGGESSESSSDESATEDEEATEEDDSSSDESSGEEGGELPETSAPYATYALLGLGLSVLSGAVFVVRREE